MKIRTHNLKADEALVFNDVKGKVSVYIVEGQCSALTYGQPLAVTEGLEILADQGPIVVRTIHG